jgi:UDP-N-acetylmuramoyl-L-alanyl-D-glutamate--2,6-diaminopimelate ligase
MVDYAHTPAGLEVVLQEARGLAATPGRVLVVFGCGGNRDRAKRPIMGRVATSLSDVAVLTSDNPRDEDPLAIIEEVRAGVGVDASRASSLIVEPDRRRAIGRVLREARPGDVVVIAGKGHETYQEIGGRRLPFNDVEEARRALSVHFHADPSSWVPGRTEGDGTISGDR